MSDDNNIKNYNAADIEKYHKGLLSSKERHALEKAALDDPFLADALEGYAASGVNVRNDITELKDRLHEKVTGGRIVSMDSGRRSQFAWWRVAALIILIGGAGFLVYQFVFNNEKENVALLKEGNKNQPVDTKDNTVTSFPATTTQSEQPIKVEERATDQNTNNQKAETVSSAFSGKNAGIMTEQIDTLSITDFKKNEVSQVTLAPTTQAYKESDVARKDAKVQGKEIKSNIDGDGVADKFDKEKQGIAASKNRNFISTKKDNELYRNNYFRGRILDSSNSPLPFANITNVNDNVGTYADAKGYFTLISPDSVLNVQVRSVGFENNNVELRSNLATNRVVLQEDRNSLSEIVISNSRPNAARLQELRESNIKIEEPEPADGWDNYDTYLVNNLNPPDEQRTNRLNGQVEVSFDVNKNGQPINIKVERSLCKSCDEEAIRLVKEGPKWKRKSKNTRARVAVPFND